jgi:hypothetical protein
MISDLTSAAASALSASFSFLLYMICTFAAGTIGKERKEKGTASIYTGHNLFRRI